MYRREIKLRADLVNFPLEPVWVGQASAAVFRVTNIPAGISAVSILITTAADDAAQECAGSTVSLGEATVYCAPWIFAEVGTGNYQVVLSAADPSGDEEEVKFYAGTGLLTVMDAELGGIQPVAPVIPRNSYARNPITEKYHLITAEVNELGEITLSVAEEGVDNV